LAFNAEHSLLGNACAEYRTEPFVTSLASTFSAMKSGASATRKKNAPEEMKENIGVGDVCARTAIDAEAKLISSYLAGDCAETYARDFIDGLAKRLAYPVQLMTDGRKLPLDRDS
jgi:hypothetical protein